MSFLKYPAYKDSGVAWLGEVPAHWEVKRIKHLVATLEQGWSPQCEGFPVQSDDEWGVLKVGCVNGGVFRPDENKALPPELEPVPALGLAAGDLLISRANTRELVGGAAIVSQAYPRLMLCDKLYRIRLHPAACVPTYLASYLGTAQVRSQIELAATGASSSMLNIGQSTILELETPVPPLSEQTAIATFLDRETAKIDALVAEQEKLIALLQEKRQAVISHAVTKGLDLNVPMKDSGVEWLGEVPGHWEVKRLRNVATLNPSKSEVSHLLRDTEVSFLPMEAVGDDGTLNLDRTRPIGEVESGYTYFREGDVTIAKITPCFENGKGAVMRRLHNGHGFGTTELIVVRPVIGAVLSDFLHSLFISNQFRQLGEAAMYGAGGQKRVPDDFVRDFSVALPPLVEQAEIHAFIDRETAKLDTLTAEARSAITLLQERRTALISAAVTGQIDVRGLTGGANTPVLVAASAYAVSA